MKSNAVKAAGILFIIGCFMLCSQPPPAVDTHSVIEDLIKVPGVSMHENAVLEKVKELLPEEVEYRVDDMNNLLVTIGDGEPEILFIAHMDEIGLEVTGINSNGTLSVRQRGGSYTTIWESKVVKICNESRSIDGIIPPRSSYMDRNPEDHSRSDLIVNVGTVTKRETESLGIKPGDFVVQTKRITPLAGGRFTAGSVDDRAGCAAQLIALKRLLNKNLNNKVTFAWCVEEETGLTGSGHIAKSYAPDYAFAVDTFVSSDAPRDPKNIGSTPLGDGPILRVIDSSSIASRRVFEEIAQIARSENIKVQWGITSGGTDASRFLITGSNVLPLSWPGIYSHSYISVFDIRDVDALIDLIVAISENL